MRISQRSAIGTPLVNPSPLGGQERIGLYTTFLVDGTSVLLPDDRARERREAFQEAFRRIGESIV